MRGDIKSGADAGLTGSREEIELLARSGELLGSSLDLETTLGQVARFIVPRMADWAAVDVIDDGGVFRRVGVAHIDPGGEDLLLELDRRYPLRPKAGQLRGQVVATRQPVALFEVSDEDLRRFARDEKHRRLLGRLGMRSAMWVPLIARDRVLGVISAGYGKNDRRYGPADLELLTELGRRAALAVDNALLFRALGRAERRQAAIAALGQRALTGDPLPEVMQYAAEIVAATLNVPFAEVLELQPDGTRLRLVAGVGWKPGTVGQATVDAQPGSQGGYTLTKVEPVVVTSMSSETRFRPPALLVDHGVESGLTVIIGSVRRPYGVLGAHTRVERQFAEDDINFLLALAHVMAAAIERQRTENRLGLVASAERARAAELKAVIESIGDPVIVCDSSGSVVLANPAAEALLGRTLQLGIRGILRSFEWPAESDDRSAAGGRLDAIELSMPSGSGTNRSEIWVELSTYPVAVGDEAGDGEAGTILILRDVTAARNAREVREAFLGILSHELRTPVTTIYGGSAMLSRADADVSEEVRRSVHDDIRAEADRLYRLVENLLVLSRVERQGLQIESEPVLLQRLLARVVEAEGARWPTARFVLELPAGLPPVAGEETYLEQVLRNLLANAAKYGGDGRIMVTAVEKGSSVRVSVADEGPGFEAEVGERLFELFYRSPDSARRVSGAGIGLFVSQQLVQAMGGRISAANRPERGAEFVFEVPVFAE